MTILRDDELGILSNAAIPEEIRKTLAAEFMATRRETIQQKTSYLSVAKNPTVAVAIVGVLSVFANFAVTYALNGQAKDKDTEIEKLRATITSQRASEQEKADLEKAEREFSYRIIEREMARATDSTERAQVLYFLSSIGMLKGLDNAQLQGFAKRELESQGKDVSKIGVPPTLGFDKPNYSVPLLEGNSNGIKIANIAITELNRNFLEDEAPDIIAKYWTVLGPAGSSYNPNNAWSAAFTSWVIKESATWPDFQPLATSLRIWSQAKSKGHTFLPGEKPLEMGDIVFFARRSAQCDIAAVREGAVTCVSSSGIVHVINGDSFQAITGNEANAVRSLTLRTTDANIIGFVRL